MNDKTVYRSTHPDALAHEDGYKAAHANWKKRVDEALVELGFPASRNIAMRGDRVTGIEHPDSEPVPDGWRRDPKLSSSITPFRSRKRGREIAAVLDGLTRPDPRRGLPGGMPHVAMAKGRMLFMHPGLRRVGDAVFVVWSAEPDDGDMRHLDPAIWERIKLSEYYAAVEAAEETGR